MTRKGMQMLSKKICRATAATLLASCTGAVANAADISVISSSNQIVTVNSASPSTVVRTTAITGLAPGQTIVAFDARPAAGGRIFYGISNTGQLYSINAMTGAASAVGNPIALQGTAFALDFNPTADRIRLISNTGQNLRINPENGSVVVDRPLNILIGGQMVPVAGHTAAAYSNNFAGATSTTLFVINTQTGLLEIQNLPNEGTLVTVGGLGGNAAGTVSGFDISITGENRVSVAQNGVTNVYSVNLETGAATFVGTISNGIFQGLAYAPTAFAAEAGLTANQAAVAGAFDNFTSVGTGFVQLLTTLDRLPDAAARADAFSQLGPVSFGILPDAVLETDEFVHDTVRTYLGDIRQGGSPIGDRTMIDEDRGIGGYLLGAGRSGDLESRGDRGTMHYGAAAIIAGLDVQLAPTSLVGVTGGYDKADIRLNPISPNSRAKTWFVGGYGALGFGPIFVDLIGSYGETNLDLRRNVAFGSFSNNSVAETDARYFSASATAGLSGTDFAGFHVEPYIGLRYADLKLDNFTEGAALTALSVGRQDVESLQGLAGLRIAANYRRGDATIRPRVRAEYQREFQNDESRLITASFNGTGIGSPFEITTTPLDRDRLLIGAGLTISGNGPVGMVAEYTGQFLGGHEIHGLKVGAHLRF